VIHEPMGNLDRNKVIAASAVDGLIATPHHNFEELRSGTWHTLRQARKLNLRENDAWASRPIYIILRHGAIWTGFECSEMNVQVIGVEEAQKWGVL
jgi:hypothetical protein